MSDLDFSLSIGRSRRGKKKNAGPNRSTKRMGPGHTVVTYDHRTLHYRFKQSKEEFDRAKAARIRKARKEKDVRNGRRNAVKRNAKGTRRSAPRTSRRDDSIYVNPDGSYSTATGRDVTYSTRGKADRGLREIRKRGIARDDYDIDDIRALLEDARWDEVAGRRWMYDDQEAVRQFHRYMRR